MNKGNWSHYHGVWGIAGWSVAGHDIDGEYKTHDSYMSMFLIVHLTLQFPGICLIILCFPYYQVLPSLSKGRE